jgi:eukaryotic-like serine/threonine-protein kinase
MPIDVFISYAQQDDGLRQELETHLAPLKRSRVIEGCHPGRVGPNDARQAAIAARLDTARVILLLVSADYLAFKDRYEHELAGALARHRTGSACVIPVLVRACEWAGAPFSGLGLLPQRDGAAAPVTSWPNRDEAWISVVRAIRAAVARLVRHAEAEAAAP